MKRFSLLIGAATLALTIPSTVLAQEVIMRRPLPVPTAGAEWRVTPFVIYDQFDNVVQPQNACGPYEQRRQVDCVQRGEVVGDYYCREAGPKPDSTKNEFLDAGCSYTWYQGGFQDPGPSCSNAERQEQIVECRRDFDNEVVSDALCSGNKPDTERTVVDHSTCTYSWNDEDPFADPGPNCTAGEEWTKNVFCERDLDKQPVAESMCDTSSRPSDIDIRADYSTCTYSWDNDEYVDPGASCTATETQTRAVWCKRDLDDNVEPDSSCDPTQRPALSQVVEDYSDCTYEWREGGFDNPGGASCNASETQTQTVTCQRSNGDTVEDSFCTETKPDTQRVVEDFDSCTYAWDPGAWSNPGGASCTSAEDQTRTVVCRRSNGQIADDSFCTGTKPPSTRTVPDYDSCTYAWHQGGWNNPGGASCTSSETQTQTVTCRRSNGETVADSFCTGTKPPSSRNVPDYDSCTYEWDEGAWSNPGGASCTTSETRTRSVVCRRSNNEVVADSFCSGNKPATSQPFEDLDGCTYEWREGGFGPWTSTCSNSATRSQSVTCRRSDGTIMTGSQESLCTTNDGPKPAAQEGPMGIYSTCGYTPTYSAWSACDGTSRSRTMSTCRRDTGDNVALSNCTSRGHELTETESCRTYAWKADGFGSWNNTCSSNATRPVIYKCESSAGGFVADSFCTTPKPVSNDTGAVYSSCTYTAGYGAWSACDGTSQSRSMNSCTRSNGDSVPLSNCSASPSTETRSCVTYSWQQSGWGSWNSTCSANATRPAVYVCKSSSGNTTVADSFCSGNKPTGSESSPIYSGCGYSAVNWTNPANPTCSAANTETQNADCRRDDGTIVADSECTSRSVALTRTVNNSADYSGCGYSAVNWTNPANPTCSAANTETQTADCRRSDGTIVSDSVCTSNGVSLTRTVSNNADYSGCSYSATNWTNPANPTCSAANTETQTADCRRSDGTIVSDSNCTNRSIALTRTVSNNADYSGCGYSATNWTNPANPTCSAANTETQTADCRRDDGTIVSDSNCTSRGISLSRTVNNNADYSGCNYTAVNWTGWTYASTCSTNTSRTRTADCRRSDGTIVGDSQCTSRGVSLTQTQTGQTNTTGCGYEWRYGAWQDPGASCTPSERQTRTETCRRDDGASVNVSFCSGVSGRQLTYRDVEDFSGCNPGQNLEVDWNNWSNWSSMCSTSASRSRTGTCEANGVAVAASVCTSRGLAVSETQTSAQYSSCSYTAGYGAWGTCSGGSQSRTITSCTRIVPQGNQSGRPASECESRGWDNPETRSCTPPPLNDAWCNQQKFSEASRSHAFFVNYGAQTIPAGNAVPAYGAYTSANWGLVQNYDGSAYCMGLYEPTTLTFCRFDVNPTTRATSNRRCASTQISP